MQLAFFMTSWANQRNSIAVNKYKIMWKSQFASQNIAQSIYSKNGDLNNKAGLIGTQKIWL